MYSCMVWDELIAVRRVYRFLKMGVNERAVQYIYANLATAQEWFCERSEKG